MLRAIKQVRSAIGLLNPDEVRKMAGRELDIGLVAATPSGYAAMEDFLVPAGVPHDERVARMERIHRAGDAGAPDRMDLVIYEQGLPCPDQCFTFHRDDPGLTMRHVLRGQEELGLALARSYPAFRKPVVDLIVHAVSRENALFAVATALPNIIPSLIELPWAMSEFASDTAFLTLNQVRMAFLIAAATGKEVGFLEQKAEIASIVASAFGWRAIARELAGKIPLGGGLIPKGAIAYAGTFVIGKGLAHLHHAGSALPAAERRKHYAEGLERGRELTERALDRPQA
jgi:hypothetical protein